MAVRTDRAELLRPVRTPEGYLLAEGYAARPGVYTYVTADGSTIRELVTADTLSERDSLVSLGRKPVTLGHPTVMVDASNVGEYGVGDIDGDLEVEERGYIRVRVAVRRGDAVQAVDAGTHQLSLGYTCDVLPTAGTHPQFGPYDAEQKNRRYNHLAIVERGRHGSPASLRADEATMVVDDAAPTTTPDKEGPMRLDEIVALLLSAGLPQEKADEAAKAILDSPDTKNDADASELATAIGEKRAEQLRADAAEAEVKDLRAKLDAVDEAAIAQAYIAARAPLEKACAALKIDAEGSNADLRESIAKAAEITAEHVDGFVLALGKFGTDARFDGLAIDPKPTPKKDAEPDIYAKNAARETGKETA